MLALRLIFLIPLFCYSLQGFSDGVLPRGVIKKKKSEDKATNNAAKQQKNIKDSKVEIVESKDSLPEYAVALDCFKYIASVPNLKGQFFSDFSGSDKLLYLRHGETVTSESNVVLTKSELISVGTEDFKFEPMMKINIPTSSGINIIGKDFRAVSFVSWNVHKNTCESSQGQIYSFSRDQNKKSFTSSGAKYSGKLGVFNEGGKLAFFDEKFGQTLIIDPRTYQIKKDAKVDSYGKVLYKFIGNRKFLVLRQTDEGPYLDLILYGRKKPMFSVKLFENEKVVFGDEGVGTVKLDVDRNQVTFYQIGSGIHKNRLELGTIKLPKVARVSEASFFMNFKKNIVVVYGSTPSIQNTWDRLYAFNVGSGSNLLAYSPPKGHYLDFVSLTPSGEALVFDLKRMDNNMASYLVRYQLISSKTNLKKSQRIKSIKF